VKPAAGKGAGPTPLKTFTSGLSAALRSPRGILSPRHNL
jgi:hypothetical protein